jgi:hypothetical protein
MALPLSRPGYGADKGFHSRQQKASAPEKRDDAVKESPYWGGHPSVARRSFCFNTTRIRSFASPDFPGFAFVGLELLPTHVFKMIIKLHL